MENLLYSENFLEMIKKFEVPEHLKDKVEELKNNWIIARKAITDAVGKTVCKGYIKCPICENGKLHFAQYENGHIHGKCTTEGCMNWGE
jgi:hypothetical protein